MPTEGRGLDGVGLVDEAGRLLVRISTDAGSTARVTIPVGQAPASVELQSHGWIFRGRGGLVFAGDEAATKPTFGLYPRRKIAFAGVAIPWKGTLLQLREAQTGRITIELHDESLRPANDPMTRSLPCGDFTLGPEVFSFDPTEVAVVGQPNWNAVMVGDELPISASPGQPTVVVYKPPDPGEAFAVLEERDGWGRTALHTARALVHGWTPKSELKRASNPGAGELGMVNILNQSPPAVIRESAARHRCKQDVPILARRGDRVHRLGIIEAHVTFDVVKKQGSLVRLRYERTHGPTVLRPAPGVIIGVPADALARCKSMPIPALDLP